MGTLFTILRSRALRLAVLAFQAVWLNAVVPGHRRGAVALPGDDCDACKVAAADACCPAMPGEGPAKPDVPVSKDPAAHCAICYFAAMLSTPPVIDCTPPAHRLLETLKPPRASERPALLVTLPYDGRGPPIDSFPLL